LPVAKPQPENFIKLFLIFGDVLETLKNMQFFNKGMINDLEDIIMIGIYRYSLKKSFYLSLMDENQKCTRIIIYCT